MWQQQNIMTSGSAMRCTPSLDSDVSVCLTGDWLTDNKGIANAGMPSAGMPSAGIPSVNQPTKIIPGPRMRALEIRQ